MSIVALVLAATFAAGPSHPTSELVGVWHGTSTCTKADWNAACHDEEVVYDFHDGRTPKHVVVHAYKIVGGKADFMGDLDFSWDETSNAWKAEFASPRVHSRWLFEVTGESLAGKAFLLPEMRVGRTVQVTRHHGPAPWSLTPGP